MMNTFIGITSWLDTLTYSVVCMKKQSRKCVKGQVQHKAKLGVVSCPLDLANCTSCMAPEISHNTGNGQ